MKFLGVNLLLIKKNKRQLVMEPLSDFERETFWEYTEMTVGEYFMLDQNVIDL